MCKAAPRYISTRRSLGTIRDSAGPAVVDHCDRCGKRASRDALRALLRVVHDERLRADHERCRSMR
jgi:hypothetical protein